jgi:pyruvate dehydrogenase E2 component (dihydrolipoamide acetyltransferase)
MDDAVSVIIPRYNVNDETVEVLEWLVSPGQLVEKDQPLVEIETSKSTMQIEAPAAGYVHRLCEPGTCVSVGGTIGYVTSESHESTTTLRDNGHVKPEPQVSLEPRTLAANSEEKSEAHAAGTQPAPVNGEAKSATVAPSPTRFSTPALNVAQKHNLDVSAFGGQRGLVRAADVLTEVNARDEEARRCGSIAIRDVEPAQASSIHNVGEAPTGVSVRYEELPRRKKTEARLLRSGSNNALASLVSVSCPTQGLRAAIENGSTRGESLTAVILFETARLLRKFPLFNAYHDNGRVAYHEEVNIGFALDAGYGLMVPAIRYADQKSLAEINWEINERVVQYLSDELPFEALCGVTFTISDLSSEEGVSFVPLISDGQSAILGVGGEFFPAGSSQGLYNLALAFDHQLAEGRMAAGFLKELRRRLQGYEGSLRSEARQAHCRRCSRTAEEIRALDAVLVSSAVPAGMVCSLCLAGY